MSRGQAAGVLRAVCGLWGGLVIGGSLIAAPAKFQVASLSRELALEVGRAQFAWLSVAEWILFCAVVVCFVRCTTPTRLAAAAALATFLLQRFVLMPRLEERTLLIIKGGVVEPSSLHAVYIAVEIVKVAILVALAFGVGGLSRSSR